MPARQTASAAGLDLAAADEIWVAPREVAKVPTGLVLDVPEGYCLGIVARSSLPGRGLFVANAVGIVDSDYDGPADEVKILVYNHTDGHIQIKAGERLAQAILLPVIVPTIVDYEPVGASRGGFGSTGR